MRELLGNKREIVWKKCLDDLTVGGPLKWANGSTRVKPQKMNVQRAEPTSHG